MKNTFSYLGFPQKGFKFMKISYLEFNFPCLNAGFFVYLGNNLAYGTIYFSISTKD